jgi:hypothetical protein
MHRTPPRLAFPFALCTLLFVGLLSASPAHATDIGEQKVYGLGLGVGQPTGVEFNWFFAPRHALHASLGVGWMGAGGEAGIVGRLHLRLNADYNFYIRLYEHEKFHLPLYFGAGVSFFFWFRYRYGEFYFWGSEGQYVSYFGIGLRVPIGVSLQFKDHPVDVFAEVAPGAGLFPGIGAYFDGTAGFRVYF